MDLGVCWGRETGFRLEVLVVGELFGGSSNRDPSTYLAVGELFSGSSNRDPSTYLAVGELFGGSSSASVLLQKLVEFVGGRTIEGLNRMEIHS